MTFRDWMQTGLLTLLPSVVDAVKGFNIPVIAAGGIVDGRGYVAALALGAQGICMGTRSNNPCPFTPTRLSLYLSQAVYNTNQLCNYYPSHPDAAAAALPLV